MFQSILNLSFVSAQIYILPLLCCYIHYTPYQFCVVFLLTNRGKFNTCHYFMNHFLLYIKSKNIKGSHKGILKDFLISKAKIRGFK